MITQCLKHTTQTPTSYLAHFKKKRLPFAAENLPQVEVLHKGDFRVMPEDSVAKSFPTLEGAQVSKEVWARTYVPWIFGRFVPNIWWRNEKG